MNINFPSKKIDLTHQLSRSKSNKPKQLTKFDELQINPTARQTLTVMLDEALEHFTSEDVDEVNEKITSKVKGCVVEVCPKADTMKKKEPWEDIRLQEQIKELRSCRDNKEIRKLQKKDQGYTEEIEE